MYAVYNNALLEISISNLYDIIGEVVSLKVSYKDIEL